MSLYNWLNIASIQGITYSNFDPDHQDLVIPLYSLIMIEMKINPPPINNGIHLVMLLRYVTAYCTCQEKQELFRFCLIHSVNTIIHGKSWCSPPLILMIGNILHFCCAAIWLIRTIFNHIVSVRKITGFTLCYHIYIHSQRINYINFSWNRVLTGIKSIVFTALFSSVCLKILTIQTFLYNRFFVCNIMDEKI